MARRRPVRTRDFSARGPAEAHMLSRFVSIVRLYLGGRGGDGIPRGSVTAAGHTGGPPCGRMALVRATLRRIGGETGAMTRRVAGTLPSHPSPCAFPGV